MLLRFQCSNAVRVLYFIFLDSRLHENTILGRIISNTKFDCGSMGHNERFIPGVLKQVFDSVGYTVGFSMLHCNQGSLFHIFGFEITQKSNFGEDNFQHKI